MDGHAALSDHRGVAWATGETGPTRFPPRSPPTMVQRPRLDDVLRSVLNHRLTCVVAERGYGKTTLLASFAARVNCAWCSLSANENLTSLVAGLAGALASRVHGCAPEILISAAAEGGSGDAGPARAQALAGLICDSIREQLTPLVLVFDNVDRVIGDSDCSDLIEALFRQAPEMLHVVLASRTEPPFELGRLRSRGDVLDVTAADLVFTTAEIDAFLRAAGLAATADAGRIDQYTGGWPLAVNLVIDLLRDTEPRDRGGDLDALLERDGDLCDYLAERVLSRAGPDTLALIRTVAHIGSFTPELCAALGCDVTTETMRSLQSRGILFGFSGADDWYELNPVIAEHARTNIPYEEPEVAAMLGIASDWFDQRGQSGRAVRAALRAGDPERLSRLVTRHGDRLIAERDAETLLAVTACLSDRDIDAHIARVLGEASTIRSRVDDAVRWFERAGATDDVIPAEVAWRAALPLVARGSFVEALKLLQNGYLDGGDPREEAILLAWRSYLRRAVGDHDGSRDDADAAMACAEIAADDLSLAAAHAVVGLTAASSGKRSMAQDHWRHALTYAERVGDVLWIVRIRTLRATHHVRVDEYDAALEDTDAILDLADAAGLNDARAQALTVRATARFLRGRVDEAIVDLRRAIDLYEGLGSAIGLGRALTAAPARLLGDVLRSRGANYLARDACERSVAAAESGASVLTRAMCHAALARALAATDLDRAAEHIDAALESDVGASLAYVRTAAAAVSLARGDRSRAAEHAHRASDLAAEEGDRGGIAWATEMLAAAEPDASAQRRHLEEALATWREIGAPLEAARVSVALAALLPAGDAYPLAEAAFTVLQEAGARHLADDAATVLDRIALEDQPAVRLQTLGGFSVKRFGVEVSVSEWQSRKARDLLKHLVVRRGGAATREMLIDALWPDDDPAKTSNRLSVALSTARTVLDPKKRFPTDHFIRADHASVALDLAHVSVDVERFLSDGTHGLAIRAEQPDEARALLRAAESSYAGNFLEEDAYEDWAVTLREYARTTYAAVAHALAEQAALEGDDESAVRYALRILDRDPFDESAHLQLVTALSRAGHHGEARRCYRTYCERMDEIGVESSPFPAGRLAGTTSP